MPSSIANWEADRLHQPTPDLARPPESYPGLVCALAVSPCDMGLDHEARATIVHTCEMLGVRCRKLAKAIQVQVFTRAVTNSREEVSRHRRMDQMARQWHRSLQHLDLFRECRQQSGKTLHARKSALTSKVGNPSAMFAEMDEMRDFLTGVQDFFQDVTDGPGNATAVPETMDVDWDKIDGHSQQMNETAARIGGTSLGATTSKCSEALAPEASSGANEPVPGPAVATPEEGPTTTPVDLAQTEFDQKVQDTRRQLAAWFGIMEEAEGVDRTTKCGEPVRSAIGAEKSPSAGENQKPASEASEVPIKMVPQVGPERVLSAEC